MHIVITGANRGIGLALAALYAARPNTTVHATTRNPARASALTELVGVRIHTLDVRDDASATALASRLTDPVDVLVHNAGVGSWENLDALDTRAAMALYDVNALGPLRVTRALRSQLKAAKGRVFHVSSGMASITENTGGGSYAYRMSKAAMNMAARTLAVELRPDGIASIVVEPGWVKTDMGGPGATLSTGESAQQLAALFDTRGMESTGKFLSRTGREIPW